MNWRTDRVRGPRHPPTRSVFGSALAVCLLLLFASPGRAAEPAMLDCPLRDAPYSLESPVIDLLLDAEARAVLERGMPGMAKNFPEDFLRAKAPSFAAIMTLAGLGQILQVPGEELSGLADELAALEISDADRRARCARYDNDTPELEIAADRLNVLVFDKINGYHHGPSVDAATDAVKALADEAGWAVSVTDKGGAFTPETLARFDVVVWNNVSGDVLTLSQRQAFVDYMNGGGGFLGIHGTGGDSVYFWDWYADTLIGARFIGHPMNPQFQDARLVIKQSPSGIGQDVAPGWVMNDEWYSFAASARAGGAQVVATLDESSYVPGTAGGRESAHGGRPPHRLDTLPRRRALLLFGHRPPSGTL